MRLLGITLAFLLLGIAPAGAAYEPLGSGQTKLVLDPTFCAALKKSGVKLRAVAPARLAGGAVVFEVTGGKLDPTDGRGSIESEGALILQAGKRKVPIRDLRVKTTSPRGPLTAKVGGSQLKLATAEGLKATRDGFGERVEVPSLSISATLASRLGKKLRLPNVFKAGVPLGSVRSLANPATIALVKKNRVTLTLAAGFQQKLDSLFVAVNPIFPAEHPSAFTIPISGGKLALDGAQGRVETQGALEFLQLGGGQVFWREPWLDLDAKAFSAEVDAEPSPPYAGKVGRFGVGALTLSAPPTANAKVRTVSASGVTLTLDPGTAAMFNEVFSKPQGREGVFEVGEPLATLSFLAQGQ